MICVIVTGTLVCILILNQNHAATAQQLLNGTSFQMGNITFSHHTTSVNGIQLQQP
jgi:hypothetical protein